MARIARHLSYWVVLYLVLVILTGSAFISGLDFEDSFSVDELIRQVSTNTFINRLEATAIDLMVIIPYTYIAAYWLFPLLTAHSYERGVIWLIVITAIAHLIQLYEWGLRFDTPKNEAFTILWISFMVFVNMGPPVLCGLFITIKLTKMWYINEERKLTLVRENVNAELQLLKAQIHPHFLFNTLNNIYSFSLRQSSTAAELVGTLSELLKYMINDCQESLVPVEKELKMVEHYIDLEKVRYGKRLRSNVNISGNFHDKVMAPLLLIPFIENSFKHGTSRMLEHPWFELSIEVGDGTLRFILANSRPHLRTKDQSRSGIGLKNVKQRLALLYPHQHTLKLESRDESFVAEMVIPVHPASRKQAHIHTRPEFAPAEL